MQYFIYLLNFFNPKKKKLYIYVGEIISIQLHLYEL